jgi:DNA-binding NarL/FixJ family response regulator
MTDHFLLQLGPPSDTTKWVMIGLGAFVLVYLMVLRPMMRGKKKDPLATPRGGGGIRTLSSQRAVERDMQNLLVEYEGMIRNMTAGLDTRAAKLEMLIKEADEKLAALKAATAAGAGGVVASLYSSTEPGPGDVPPAPAPGGPDPRHLEIYDLTDQGLSAKDVARKLGRPSGEVELILALRGARD